MRLPWPRTLPAAEKVVLVAALLCLGATVTNGIPLSAGLAVGLLLVPFLLIGRQSVPRVTFSLALLLGYFLLWTLLYDPFSLGSYSFYRRDGNVFITFAPLLFLGLLRLRMDLQRVVRLFLLASGALNALFLAIYAVTGHTIFFYEEGIYHFLFHAHNAAGGYLAVTTALAFGYYYGTREKIFLLIALGNFLGLLAADSRGSVLGLMIALAVVFVLRGRFTRLMIVAMVVTQVAMVSWFSRIAPEEVYLTVEVAVLQPESFEALPRSHTIAMRAFSLWPRAWYLFQASPLIGTGFGSFNDFPYQLSGVPPLYQVNRPAEVRHNDTHAHHTFLHVMAETGLLGLLLLIYFLASVRRFILSLPSTALRCGLELALWVNVVSSFTEHRLFTPSQMLPYTILLGLVVAHRSYVRSRTPEEATVPLVTRPAVPALVR